MREITIEELRVLITGETTSLRRELRILRRQLNDTERDVRNSTAAIAGAFRKLAGVIAAIGLGAAFVSATKDAMSFEAALQQVNRIMGAYANEFRRWSNESAIAFGVSRSEAIRYGAVFGNLISTFTAGSQDIMRYTRDLIKASAVISAATGRTMEDVMFRIRSGLLGNTEAIEDLGVNVNVAMLESTEAFRRFANGKSWAQLSFQTQQQIRLFGVMEQTAKKYGTEVAKNTASDLGTLIAYLKNVKLSLGQAFLPIINVILPTLTWLAAALSQVMAVVAQFSAALFGYAPNLKATVNQTAAVTNLGNAYDKTGKKAKAAQRGVAGFDEINQLADPAAGGGDAEAPAAATPAIPEILVPQVDLDTIPKEIQEMAEKVKRILEKIFEPFRKSWDKYGPGVTSEFNKAVDGTKRVLESLGSIFSGVWDNGGAKFLENITSLGLEISRLALRIYNEFILPVVGWYVDYLNPQTNSVTKAMLDGINWLLEKMIEFVSYLAGDGFGAAQIAIGGLAGALIGLSVYKTITGVIDFVHGLSKSMGAFLKVLVANPILLVVVAIGALIGALVTAYMTNEDFRNTVDGLFKKLKDFLIPVFEGVKKIALDVWNNVLVPFGGFLEKVFVASWEAIVKVAKFLWKEILVPLGEDLKWLWQKVIEPLAGILVDSLSIAFKTVADVAKIFWNDVLVPLGDFFVTIFYKAIEGLIEILSHWWNKIFQPFGNFLKGIFQPIIEGLVKVFQFLWKEVFSPIANYLSSVFVKVFESMGSSIKTIIGGLKSIFSGLIDFITGVFTGNWSKAWDGVKQIFKGVFDSLWGIVKFPLNLIIDGINTVISGLNRISFNMPDVLGGAHIGIEIPHIPKLARGGIVDSPTLAMVGEAGKEAVVPLENTSFVDKLAGALGSAVLAAMQVGGSNRSNQNMGDVVLQVDGTTIARVLRPYMQQEDQRIGNTIIQTY
ncbi:hypothetical protein MH117_05085 [Paenibacillus sp. ACRRX]|uniref:hypothetical protein n=1 Tax=Paenibacillus sp. ACRRX TaxID=2918206 RepID=UPI001EF574BF|nr:hypothetical protein [Paenibacillus sp. ACRRX]MCG7406785.1 hypothetical protein [Paenibacillus sp. ACRRX]